MYVKSVKKKKKKKKNDKKLPNLFVTKHPIFTRSLAKVSYDEYSNIKKKKSLA